MPALITVAAVDVATRTCRVHLTQTLSFDPAVVAACCAEMVQQKQLAMVALGMRGERLADILISFCRQLPLISLARYEQWFWYMGVKSQNTSLALAC